MIPNDQLKDQALGLTTRYTTHTDTLGWLYGKLAGIPSELLPPVEGSEGENALRRLGAQCNSIGPRVLGIKRNGAIGDITWGDDNTTLDALIRGLNPEELASRLFERLFSLGIAAAVALETDNGPRVARLGGHVETISDPYDIDVILGLLQVQAERISMNMTKYRVRLWDWSETDDGLAIIREWTDVQDPSSLRGEGDISDAIFRPHYHVMQVGPDGRPLGEFQQSLPSVKAEWASQVRGDRAEESTAFPLMKIKGEVVGTNKRGPTRVVEVDLAGDVAYLLPGDLTQMHAHHDRKLERIREDLSLPGGSLGTQTPSGEALREANQKFIASSRSYANAMSHILTGCIRDYLTLSNVTSDVQVNVDINREFEKSDRVRFIIDLYREGLVPLGAAVRSVSVYLPTWSDAEVEEFINQQTTVITPDTLRAALNGGG